ncbi:YceI family protein [Methylomonas paludis]|uniref:YceI family protein n=1 Tax=Methylomonas paludis TaxID=1173101 RepID=A0A975MPP2_9GAMM|nr:YceI family protein [Methylomonas paludis]QWF71216.1 YceI family protein [Methylomonas paludis]
MKIHMLPLLLTGLALSPLAEASEFNRILTDRSTVSFVYKQMGVPMAGRLQKFAAQLSFDPDQLSTAKAVFDMDLTSIDAGSDEANAEISNKDWFNTPTFSQAKFVSTDIKTLAGNRYEVRGKMTIKGKTQNVTANFTCTTQHNTAVFDGRFTLNRADFAIGEGAWADFDVIANEVLIQFHFLA